MRRLLLAGWLLWGSLGAADTYVDVPATTLIKDLPVDSMITLVEAIKFPSGVRDQVRWGSRPKTTACFSTYPAPNLHRDLSIPAGTSLPLKATAHSYDTMIVTLEFPPGGTTSLQLMFRGTDVPIDLSEVSSYFTARIPSSSAMAKYAASGSGGVGTGTDPLLSHLPLGSFLAPVATRDISANATEVAFAPGDNSYRCVVRFPASAKARQLLRDTRYEIIDILRSQSEEIPQDGSAAVPRALVELHLRAVTSDLPFLTLRCLSLKQGDDAASGGVTVMELAPFFKVAI